MSIKIDRMMEANEGEASRAFMRDPDAATLQKLNWFKEQDDTGRRLAECLGTDDIRWHLFAMCVAQLGPEQRHLLDPRAERALCDRCAFASDPASLVAREGGDAPIQAVADMCRDGTVQFFIQSPTEPVRDPAEGILVDVRGGGQESLTPSFVAAYQR